jgi:hypothetical protein
MDGFSGRDQFSSEHSVYADVSVLAKKNCINTSQLGAGD